MVDVGEVWAYRARSGDAAAQVEVLRIGTGRPLRVKVRFLQEEFEGREEWVPPARLKVPWAGVEAWEAREARWKAVRDASIHIRGTTEDWAASRVLDKSGYRFIDFGHNRDSGILRITDVTAMQRTVGIDPADLSADPLAFTDGDGALIVPWPITLRVIRHIAEANADQLLEYIDNEEEQDRRAAVHGRYYGHGRRAIYVSAEDSAESLEEQRATYDLVRQWCGAEARGARDELLALREEVGRLGRLIEQAAARLRESGQAAAAADLEAELGVPIEVVRQAARANRESGP